MASTYPQAQLALSDTTLPAAVRLEGITKRYGPLVAVDQVSVSVSKGEFVCLLGPSGCGKTTTLRMIAGFIKPDEGHIYIQGEDVVNRPPNKRDIGMVYQSYALFPHMTVYDNIAFGLTMRKVGKKEIGQRVAWALEVVRLTGMESRKPGQLSGGQQQRVALARAIVVQPAVLLLDEPLSNLDAKLRKNMQIELHELQRKLGITTIHVTHDQEEALTLSDRLVILNQGKVEQVGTPREIYERPSSAFVADFIGRSNFLTGKIESMGVTGERAQFLAASGERLYVYCDRPVQPGTEVDVFVRPEKIRITPEGTLADAENVLTGEVLHAVYTGNLTSVEVVLPSGKHLVIECNNAADCVEAYSRGSRVDLMLPFDALRVLHPNDPGVRR